MITMGPTSHSFLSQRLRLHYLDWGNDGAPVLILVHGGKDHAHSWDWVARELRDEWHVIAPDLRGHGDSSWSPDGAYHPDYFVADLAQLVHQQGAAPVSIVAHSLGGAIALRYTGLFPENVRKLVAIEGLGLTPEETRRRAEDPEVAPREAREWIAQRRALSAQAPRRYATLDAAYARMRAANKHLSPEQARHLTIHGVNRNEDDSYSWKFDTYLHVQVPAELDGGAARARWRTIECPVWLVHGADSWASHPGKDGRAASFRDARVTSFENAGHWVHHDRFDAFVAGLRDFL